MRLIQVLAFVPDEINFQGKLTDSNGINVANGYYDFRIRVYDAAGSGSPPTGGTLLYSEDKLDILVSNGIFNLKFSPSNAALGTTDTYVQICFNSSMSATADGATGSNDGLATCGAGANDSVYDKAFSPRKKLTSNPYSLMSKFLGSTTISGDSSGALTIGIDQAGGTNNTTGQLKFISAGDNAFSTIFQPGTQSGNVTYTLPTAQAGGSGYLLTNNGSGVLSWAAPGAAATVPFSGLTAATATNTLDNTNYAQIWDWTTLSSGTGLLMRGNGLTTGNLLSLTSTSTAGGASANSKVFNISRSGANTNSVHTAYGLYSTVTNTGTTSTNVAGYFSATGGTNNYAAIFENGNVGIGTTTPVARLHNGGTTLFGTLTISDLSGLGANSIGTAAATVDLYTSFALNQTTSSKEITVPNPTNTTAGRTIYISNIGTTYFHLYGVTLQPSESASLIWDGDSWNISGDGSVISGNSSTGLNSAFWNWSAPLSKDTFTDTNGTQLTSHTPDIGPSWSVQTSPAQWTIQSNQLSRTNNINDHAYVNVGQSDMIACAHFTSLNGPLSSIIIRRQDGAHYWEIFFDPGRSGWQMSKVNGAPDDFQGPLLAGTTGTACLSAVGNTITAMSPGGQSFSVVDSDFNSSTVAGVIVDGNGSTASTIDNWIVAGRATSSVTKLSEITILDNGNVGIGDTSPASLLTVGTGDAFQINSSGIVTSGTWNGTALTDAYVSDTLTSSLFVGSGSTTTAIDLATAEVSGVLPIANGGTNSTATPTNGGVAYGTGSAYAFTSAGTSGYVLQSNGAAAPTWIDPSTLSAGSVAFTNITSGTNTTAAMVVGTGSSLTVSGSGTINSTTLLGSTWASPGAIGSTTPNTGAFTTLSANSTLGVTGTASFNGAVNLGDATSDDITFNGYVASNIIPKTDDTYDLGISSLRWRDLYLGPSSLHLVSTTGETSTARDWKLGINETDGSTDGNFRILEGSNEYVTISTAGNFGIGGDTTPDNLFSVGSTSQFQVNSSGAIAAITGYTQASGTFSHTYSSGTDNTDAQSLSVTNTNTTATTTNVRGQNIALVGTTNSNSNANTITGINFANVSAISNNTFNGITFGTGFNNFLTSSTINIAANGTITGATWNGSALTDAFVSDTLTSSIFIGSGSTTNAIDLATAEVSGTLPIANGGTNSTATPTNGGVAYGTGTAYAFTAAGSSGEILRSNGAAAPTWVAQSTLTAGTVAFSGISSATNTTAAMVVGTGASLTVSGSGTINSTTLLGSTWASPGTIGSTTPNTAAFTTLSANSTVTFSALTQGSIPFIGASGVLSQNNSQLFWDNTNTRLGIGVNSSIGNKFVVQSTEAERGFRVTDGSNSNIVVQGLSGANSGYQTIQFNGYNDSGEARYNAAKNRWRLIVDQRSSTDKFIIDTYDGSTGTPIINLLTSGFVGINNGTPTSYLHLTASGQTVASSSTAEFTTASFAAPTITLTGTTAVTSQMDSYLFTAPTITDASAVTVSNAATLTVNGAPVRAGFVTLTNTYGIKVNTTAVSTATNAYGIYAEAPTGATNNFAAGFSGNVTTTGLLTTAGGLTVSGGSTTFTPSINANGGINNNGNTYLQINGGTNNVTYFNGFVGIAESTPEMPLEVVSNTVVDGIRSVGTGTGSVSGGSVFMATNQSPTGSGQRVGGLFYGYTDLGATESNPGSIELFSAESWATNKGSYMVFSVTNTGTTTRTEKARLDTTGLDVSGLLQINTTTQNTQRLCHTGTDGANLVGVTLTDCNAAGQVDFAEYYGTDDTSLEAGDIVAIDTSRESIEINHPTLGHTSKSWVKKADNRAHTIGIISTNPFVEILGEGLFDPSENPKPVGLNGRVPVKVNSSNGNIQKGDLITLSSTPGVGAKAVSQGFIVGRALNDYINSDPNAVGKITVFIDNSYYNPTTASGTPSSEWTLSGSNLSTNHNVIINGNLTAQQITSTSLFSNSINISGGKFVVNTNGDVVVQGSLEANTITSTLITVTNATIKTLKVDKLSINQTPETGDPTIGTGTILAGDQTVVINNANITPKAKVFVSITSENGDNIRVINKVDATSFTVKLNTIDTQDVTFDYWIVGE